MAFKDHLNKWLHCGLCNLCEKRIYVCLYRGKIPADVVFIGEAPGQSEDARGIPFCGPAGELQDQLIAKAIPSHIRIGFTNLVACIPLGGDDKKLAEPEKQHIKACRPRLREIIHLAKPRLIILVGKLAKRWIGGQADFAFGKGTTLPWIPEGNHLRFAEIDHPAHILRAVPAQKSLLKQRSIVVMANAVQEMIKNKEFAPRVEPVLMDEPELSADDPSIPF